MANSIDAPDSSSEPGATTCCALCAHAFDPGGLAGNMYCPKCGRRFNPNATMEETVALGTRAGDDNPPPSMPEYNDDEIEERFGDYDILSEVARGGMGVVYRARQRTLKRIVALKVLRAGEGATEEDLERFVREAKSAASLSHPNIVPIHEFSVYKNRHYFTMDFIEGVPLDRMLEHGPIRPDKACEFVEIIATAIDYAHGRSIIHRDLKPANIIIDRTGRPMLTDFGLAVNLASDPHSQRMTKTGAVMGTIPYIPPEQAGGNVDQIEARSDVYSLGAVLYEMITGRPPFEGETQFELLRRVIHQEPPPPRSLVPRIHPDVETICMRCLEKDPRRRYQSAQALADDCRAFLQGEMIRARPATVSYKIIRYLSRRRWWSLLVASVILLGFISLRSFYKTGKLKKEWNEKKEEVKKLHADVKDLKTEKAKKEQELRREWRQEYGLRLGRDFKWSTNPYTAFRQRVPWLDQKSVRLSANHSLLLLKHNSSGNTVRGLLGLPLAFPLDFRLTCQVSMPPENAGGLEILINADNNFRIRDGTCVLRIGCMAHPGASITRGGAILKEEPSFSLPADRRMNVSLERSGGKLKAVVDGSTVLEAETDETVDDAGKAFLALGVNGGELNVSRVTVEVKGMSRSNIESILEVGNSMLSQRDYRLALKLYERVMIERTRLPIYIRAMHGYARSLAMIERDQEKLILVCKDLIRRLNQTSRRDLGEKEFIAGLIMKEVPSKNRPKELAMRFFREAFERARPAAEEIFEYKSLKYVGPFAVENGTHALTTSFPPETAFEENVTYRGKDGATRWGVFSRPIKEGSSIYLPLSEDDEGESVFFVRRVYRSPDEMPVTIYTRSDDGFSLWVNGKLMARKDVKRSLSQAMDTTSSRFRQGENVVLMKIHNQNGPCGFSLKVTPATRAYHGVYGLLAQMEMVSVLLKANRADQALGHLTDLQKDGTLRALSLRYPEEVRVSGFLTTMLSSIDQMLKAKKNPEVPAGFLEAMGDLYPTSEELSLRYHRLAKLYATNGQDKEADVALLKAGRLAPNWYLPPFDRAMLYYARGESALCNEILAQATRDLPLSQELQMAIARFYLEKKDNVVRDPVRAYAAASLAIALSERRSPAAFEMAAEALLCQDRLIGAQNMIAQAIQLEKTDSRSSLQQLIMKRIAEQEPEGFEPDETVLPE